MIKKRLVGLLSHAKKYIIYQVVWQWLALICQIVMIYSAAMLLETAPGDCAFLGGDTADGGLLWRTRACGTDPAVCL